MKSGAPKKVLPIEIPAMPLDQLNRLTDNFGTKALIGEGSYGRVFSANPTEGETVAIKKLDTSSSPEPDDDDFAAQVFLSLYYSYFPIFLIFIFDLEWNGIQLCGLLLNYLIQLSIVSRLKHDHFVELKGYCLEADNRILVYEYATKGSLHDVLHGRYSDLILF